MNLPIATSVGDGIVGDRNPSVSTFLDGVYAGAGGRGSASPRFLFALCRSVVCSSRRRSCSITSCSAACCSDLIHRFSRSNSLFHLKLKYSFARSLKPSSIGIVNNESATWSWNVFALRRLAVAICSAARACARRVASFFKKMEASTLGLLLPCMCPSHLKNPSRENFYLPARRIARALGTAFLHTIAPLIWSCRFSPPHQHRVRLLSTLSLLQVKLRF